MNDFSRGLATHSLALCLADKLGTSLAAVKNKVAIIMSGGCEGAISPHILVFAVTETQSQDAAVQQDPNTKRLALGVAFTKEFLPEEQGQEAQVCMLALQRCFTGRLWMDEWCMRLICLHSA